MLLFPKNCWVLSVLGLLTFAGVTYISKYVSLGSLVFIGLFFVEMVIYGIYGWLPLTGSSLYEGLVITFIITALAFIRHHGNIQRLINGTERKIGQHKNN